MKNKKQDPHQIRKQSRHKNIKCPEENCLYFGRHHYIKAYHYPNVHPDRYCALSESAVSSQSSKHPSEKTKLSIKLKKNIFKVSKPEKMNDHKNQKVPLT